MKKQPYFKLFTFFFCVLFAQKNIFAQCNGYPSLCDKRYDQVAYVTTHNGFNYGPDFLFPNQNFDIPQQLQDGVRAFMLDLYTIEGEVYLYHSFDFLGTQLFTDLLEDIRFFLEENPNEVITFILESYITAEEVHNDLIKTDLMPFVHTQSKEKPWPNLQEMIDNNQRLVILSSQNDGKDFGLDWHHYVWDFAVETDWNNKEQSDFDCGFNRGQADNSLFILNHFITDEIVGIGMPDTALLINSNPYFLNRCLDCQSVTGKIPNFLTVDFYELGDVFKTANALNEVEEVSLSVELLDFYVEEKNGKNIQLTWLTAKEYQNDYFLIEKSQDGKKFDRIGKVNGHLTSDRQHQYTFLDKKPMTNNYYRLQTIDLNQKTSYSKVIYQPYLLAQNANPSFIITPNPFSQTTSIIFDADLATALSQIIIYNTLGQKIQAIDKPNLATTAIPIDFSNQTTGVYYIQLLDEKGGIIDMKKVVYF